jgi:hypothetical protein
MPIMGSGPTPAIRQVMFFIDGEYLRKSLREIQGNEEFDLLRFPYILAGLFIRGRLSARAPSSVI